MIKEAVSGAYEIAAALGAGKKFLFFDFDGTLSSIAAEPSLAKPVDGALKAVDRLLALPDCYVVIISGRSINDIRFFFGDDRLILCGNHGAQISGAGIHYSDKVSASSKKEVMDLATLSNASFGDVPGFFLEIKENGAVAHYRKVDADSAVKIEEWFEMIIKRGPGHIRVRRGKKIFEILPAGAPGKYDAIIMIVEKLGGAHNGILFAGDDTTDVETFQRLGTFAVKIFVGINPPASADYFLKSPVCAVDFINKLAVILGGGQ